MSNIIDISHAKNAGSFKSGGGDGTFSDMEIRVSTLENDMKEIRQDLRSLVIDSAEIKGKISALPSADTIGHLRGRVDSLPTTGKMASLLGIVAAIFTVVIKWPEILVYFR